MCVCFVLVHLASAFKFGQCSAAQRKVIFAAPFVVDWWPKQLWFIASPLPGHVQTNTNMSVQVSVCVCQCLCMWVWVLVWAATAPLGEQIRHCQTIIASTGHWQLQHWFCPPPPLLRLPSNIVQLQHKPVLFLLLLLLLLLCVCLFGFALCCNLCAALDTECLTSWNWAGAFAAATLGQTAEVY